jgi:hypothetical protein
MFKPFFLVCHFSTPLSLLVAVSSRITDIIKELDVAYIETGKLISGGRSVAKRTPCWKTNGQSSAPLSAGYP